MSKQSINVTFIGNSQIWCPIYVSYYCYICFEGWWKVLL